MVTYGWTTDVRDAVRSFRARPMFAVGGVLLCAIAMAACVTAFAVVYGILWRPLPYPAADRLAVIWQTSGAERTQISYPDYADLATASVFESSAAMSGGRGSLRVGDRIERINALSIEAPGFALLGARPQLGRLLTASDADRPLAMISHRLWSTHFNADANIIGRLIWLSGREYTVVGVLQPHFDFGLPVPPSFVLENNDVWTVLERSAPFLTRRDVSTYEALVRLAPGQTVQGAQAAVDAMAARLTREHPSTNTGRSYSVVSLKDEVVAPVRRSLLFVVLAGVVTLVIALANLVILSLVRGAERQVELSVREALGAGGLRLRRQLFTEHALTAVCGGSLGALLAHALVQRLISSEAAHLPRPDAIRFDAPVFWVMGGIATLIAIVLAAQPLQLQSAVLRTGLRAAGGSDHRAR